MTVVPLMVRGRPVSVLGTIGKAVPGSVAVSFAPSGGRYCETVCPHHPENGGACYAVRTERFRKPLAARLAESERVGAESVAVQARAESAARGHRFPWFRVAAFGSVPGDPDDAPTLAALCRDLVAAGTPVHFPTETRGKRDRWTAAIGGAVAVRWSIPSPSDPAWTTDPGPVSTVAGSRDEREPDRLAAARAAASARRASTGRRTIVCPAVASRIIRTATAGKRTAGSDRAKCGGCTACADHGTDVVYPLH
jgi:NAD-dependent dihydropyrimidine dehydrogenase PreA subunit